MSFIVELINGTGFWDLLILWGILIAGPIWLWFSARDDLRSRYFRANGRWKLLGAIVAASLSSVFLVAFGIDLYRATLRAGGPWLVGIIIAALVCVVAFPMSIVGQHLRTAHESSSGRHLRIGLIGIAAIAVAAIGLYTLADQVAGFAFAALGVVAVVLGWFRLILVPDPEE